MTALAAHLPTVANAAAFAVVALLLTLGYLRWTRAEYPRPDTEPDPRTPAIDAAPDAAAATVTDELVADIYAWLESAR